ncbi:MAG: hypothetical protein ABIP58_02140, partial [Dehalococcoidia bacterium]
DSHAMNLLGELTVSPALTTPSKEENAGTTKFLDALTEEVSDIDPRLEGDRYPRGSLELTGTIPLCSPRKDKWRRRCERGLRCEQAPDKQSSNS